jgi:phage replication O-like protein O
MPRPQIERGYIKLATELFVAECSVRMAGSEWQVYKHIQRQTYGWNKKRDMISYSQFSEGTGLDRRRVIEAVKGLQTRKMIIVTKTAPRKPNVYEIQKNYGKWLVTKKTLPPLVIKKVIASDKNGKLLVTKTAPTKDTIQKTLTIEAVPSDKNRTSKTDCPVDYQPGETVPAMLKRSGCTVDWQSPETIMTFICHQRGNGRQARDWDALYAKWCITEQKLNQGKGNGNQRKTSKAEQFHDQLVAHAKPAET